MIMHLDTDFLVYALATAGPERRWLIEISNSGQSIEISAIAWYEFSRGPRIPEQLATARSFFSADGIIPFSEQFASTAAEVFRRLGSPRRRAADICIGVTAMLRGATLISRNARDFAGIPGLEVRDLDMTVHDT